MRNHEGSNATGQRDQCPKCQDGSCDNRVWYDDGHAYCFACSTYFPGEGQEPVVSAPKEDVEWNPIIGACKALPHRRISDDTARLFGYRTANVNGKSCEVANYYKDGQLMGQKIRATEDKTFIWRGNASGIPLFGQNLWKSGGRKIVITEGEIDAMSIAEVQDRKWPVVSVPSGAAGAVKAIQNNYEFVSSFKEVVICFDMDEAGQAAAKKVAEILPAGKVSIVSLPRKDANDMLVHNDSSGLLTALWNAKGYRPDGILHVREVQSTTTSRDQEVWPFPWDCLTEYLIGQRSQEISMWTSGTGSGKSTIIRELVADHLNHGRTVGMLMLEESPEETMDDLISLQLGKPVRRIRSLRALNQLKASMGQELVEFEDNLSDDEYEDAKAQLQSRDLYIYDSFGMTATDNIVSQVDYMASALGCDVVILDHITAAVTNIMAADNKTKGEREAIDEAMHNLRGIVTRTGVHLDVISQLRKPSTGKKGYEEGARITIGDLRGSGALSSVPNTVIAMERDRQAADPRAANTSVIRILKNRFTGKTGVATALYYDYTTGRLAPTDFAVDGSGEVQIGEPEESYGF